MDIIDLLKEINKETYIQLSDLNKGDDSNNVNIGIDNENKILKERIKGLEKETESLKREISGFQGQIDSLNKLIESKDMLITFLQKEK